MERSSMKPDRTSLVFGNPMDRATIRKAEAQKAKFRKKYGDDSTREFRVRVMDNPVLGPLLGLKVLEVVPAEIGFGTAGKDDQGMEMFVPAPGEKPLVIATIRMGYGHFRISMAIASAARAAGYTPYWLDLHSLQHCVAGKVIAELNGLYSLGSRLSQKYRWFDKWYWEPLNSEGFRKLSWNAQDQKLSELMAPVYKVMPREVPVVATHVWPAQAAIHAGMDQVVNIVPDNWPMALHLAEGALHAVQTPSAWSGYRTLRGMYGKKLPQPMGAEDCLMAGHFIDHELVQSIPTACRARVERQARGSALRLLFSIGGAGAQVEFVTDMVESLLPLVAEGKIQLFFNMGDHSSMESLLVERLRKLSPQFSDTTLQTHHEWNESTGVARNLAGEADGGSAMIHHVFCHRGIFEAVYLTNLLMPVCDLLVTKPSELAFYPMPKVLIRRVGGHEAWGAIRAAELGDGTPELREPEEAAAMVALMVKDPGILERMNMAIEDNCRAGIYDGARRVVETVESRSAQ